MQIHRYLKHTVIYSIEQNIHRNFTFDFDLLHSSLRAMHLILQWFALQTNHIQNKIIY